MYDENKQCWEKGRHKRIVVKKVPLGARLLSYLGVFNCYPPKSYRLYILILTFCCYAAYHMSRKPFSVVAHVLAPNCTGVASRDSNSSYNDSEFSISHHLIDRAVDPDDYIDGWPPFNGKRCKTLIGAVDYAWLFTYAVFMVGSGLIADRVNLRYFLTIGMIGSGVFVGLLGVAYYIEMHHISYFIVIQIFVGIFESTGWPGIVAVMGNWLGIQNRGLVMGIWNSHTSVGNILGTAIPAIWAVRGKPWSWAFLVPAFVMIVMGIVIFFFLVVDPVHVGLPPPKHHKKSGGTQSRSSRRASDIKNDDTEPLIPDEKESDSSKRQPVIGNGIVTDEPIEGDFGDNEKSKLIETGGHNEIETQNDRPKKQAIGLIGALCVPGVVEFSLALFFAKLVAYTFLFWLPYYVTYHRIGGRYLGEQKSNLLSTLYDVGGIIGGVLTGGLSDLISGRAITCVFMMYMAVPTLFVYRYLGHESLGLAIVFIMLCGLFINGPYALITTAVSSDLGTHKSLRENQRAKATVGAIIDGMGSLGAACGPLITGWISDDFGWTSVFYLLMVSCFLSSLMLSRLFVNEVRQFYKRYKKWRTERQRSTSHSGNHKVTTFKEKEATESML